MGKSSGSTNSTVTQTNLPSYAKPYFTSLMDRANEVSKETYQPYGGQRIADLSGATMSGINALMGSTGQNALMGQAASGLSGAANAAKAATSYQSGPITSGLSARTYNPTTFSVADIAAPNVQDVADVQALGLGALTPERTSVDGWNGDVAQAYMSPYMDDVVARQKAGAITDYNRLRSDRNAAAIKASAFGGSRQAVADYLAEEGLSSNLADIEAKGRQSAYENAQSQFERDRASKLTSDTGNADRGLTAATEAARQYLQAAQGNQSKALTLSQLRATMGLDAAKTNQAMSLETQKAGEASKQFGANLDQQSAEAAAKLGLDASTANESAKLAAAQLGLSGANSWADIMAKLGDLGQAQEGMTRQANLDKLTAGGILDKQAQAGLDLAYSDFENQRDYDRQTLNWLNGILRGVPVQSNSTVSQYGASNPYASLAGLGLGSLGLSQSTTKSGS